MTVRKTSIRYQTLGLALAGVFALTSCTSDPSAGFTDDEASGSSAPADDPSPQDADASQNALVAEVDDPIEFPECHEAEAMEGATVEWLDDVVVEEQRIDGVEAETVDLDGKQVELPGMPDLVIPEILGQAGCIIEYPAPGGCLPAVEISGSYIPGYRTPDRTLPAVELPDGTVIEEEIQPGIEAEAVEADGAYHEQVCQTEPEDASAGERISYVLRPYILRNYILSTYSRSGSVMRSATTTENNERVPSQNISSYQVPSITVGSATVGSDFLEGYRVEGSEHTEFTEDDELTAYTTSGDVLFDSDDHALRSDAESELQAIADDIAQRDGDYTITVEGHTDDLPSQQYADNTELAEQRAESVVAWFADHEDTAGADITAEGLGDEFPRASNDSEDGRQQNRRVVITVKPVDYEADIDYEVEDNGTAEQ